MQGFQIFKGSWPWPWFRPLGIPSCITHRPVPTYQISLRSEENLFRKSPLRFWSSSESRDTKTRTNENGRNSNFQGLVTLTLTVDPAMWHTVVHRSSISTHIPNFIQIEETFCGRTDGRTGGFFPPLILLGRLLEVDLNTKLEEPSVEQITLKEHSVE